MFDNFFHKISNGRRRGRTFLPWGEIFLAIVFIPLAFGTSACQTTEREQKQAQLNVLSETLTVSRSTLEELKAGKLPPAHDFHLFIKHAPLNELLNAFKDYKFNLPNDPSVVVTVKSLSINNYGSLPTVTIDATAIKESISAELYAIAVLVPAGAEDPENISFRLKVLSFVPKLKWYFFELTKLKFVKTLLSAEVSKLTDKLPLINLPVSKTIAWGAPASSNSVTIRTSNPAAGTDGSTLDLKVIVPSTETTKKLVVTKYAFISSGLHLFGVLK